MARTAGQGWWGGLGLVRFCSQRQAHRTPRALTLLEIRHLALLNSKFSHTSYSRHSFSVAIALQVKHVLFEEQGDTVLCESSSIVLLHYLSKTVHTVPVDYLAFEKSKMMLACARLDVSTGMTNECHSNPMFEMAF